MSATEKSDLPEVAWKRVIGIGGHLATPPLPHHQAYGSVPRRFESLANTRRTRMGDRAIGSAHWRALRRGPCSGLGARGHGRYRQHCSPCAPEPRLRPAPLADAVVFSTAARERPAAAAGPSE